MSFVKKGPIEHFNSSPGDTNHVYTLRTIHVLNFSFTAAILKKTGFVQSRRRLRTIAAQSKKKGPRSLLKETFAGRAIMQQQTGYLLPGGCLPIIRSGGKILLICDPSRSGLGINSVSTKSSINSKLFQKKHNTISNTNTSTRRLCAAEAAAPPATPNYIQEKEEEEDGLHQHDLLLSSSWSPPSSLWRGLSIVVLAGQVIIRILQGKVHKKNTLQQLERVGPKSLGVCLLTSTFVGMAFTIQFVREFTRLGLNRSVGGVLALAFARELSPVITSIVVAGRIGSAFAAELGTMQVSEQTDTLRVLGTDPIDYLVTPRVIACCVALPILTLFCFSLGMASSAILADGVYGVSINIILDSARRALKPWDIISAMIKSQVFGAIIAIVSSAWGVTTLGGAKGVGESTTSAVVISLVGIFIADFFLSCIFFQGAGDSLKYCMN